MQMWHGKIDKDRLVGEMRRSGELYEPVMDESTSDSNFFFLLF